MSVGKALQVLDKKDIECSICLERFKEPKTLDCIHSYCLKCLESLLQTQGKIRCPKCRQIYNDLKKEDLKNLLSNEISHLVQYVEKIESEKAAKCSNCDNQPRIYCYDCQLYMCGQCIKQHKIIPVLKDHSLYTLDLPDEQRNDRNCQIHCENVVEFFCQKCYKQGCRKCEHVLDCYKNKHDVIEIEMAIDKFNQNATDIKHMIEGIEHKLKQKRKTFTDDRIKFESQLALCRKAVEIQEKQIIQKIQEKGKALINDLEEIYKDKVQMVDRQVEQIDSNLTEVNKIWTSINATMNKPEETETLRSHEATVTSIKEVVVGEGLDKLFHKKGITPVFIPQYYLERLINLNGIGQITNSDCTYKVVKDSMSIAVTEREAFTVQVSSLSECEPYKLAATLVNELGGELATEIEDQGNGKYRIKGKCNVEGDWQMKITAGVAHIKGSPVNIKVEKQLVHTIENISHHKNHSKNAKVSDVMLDKDGGILVASYSKDLLKFYQSGSFDRRIPVPQDVKVNRMHKMSNGNVVYTNYNASNGKHVVMCNEAFNMIRSFSSKKLKYPDGLTVNEKTRILYVADRQLHCILKFNLNDGRELGQIGSEGSEVGQLNKPEDVTLSIDGHVIVADFGNNRIQMFDMNDQVIRVLVGSGDNDGNVIGPHSVFIDAEENMIISSNHKLQLFDKNGKFKKRIDNENDGLCVPSGIATVMSNSLRRVAVTNHKANNIKIFNY